MLTSVVGHYDGSKIVIDDDFSFSAGQRVIVTLLDDGGEVERRRRNAAYMAKIKKGLAQCESGHGQIHEIIEVEDVAC
jgi:hypothetical protein